MHRNAIDLGSTRTLATWELAFPPGNVRRGPAGGGDNLGGALRGSRRRILLTRMVEFDHLSFVQIWSRHFRKTHHQDSANREIRRDKQTGAFRRESRKLLEHLI